jgi:hypothetical protein
LGGDGEKEGEGGVRGKNADGNYIEFCCIFFL